MSLKVFISVFPAALCGWMSWKYVTMFTENERLRHKNRTLNDILADIEEEFGCIVIIKKALSKWKRSLVSIKNRNPG